MISNAELETMNAKQLEAFNRLPMCHRVSVYKTIGNKFEISCMCQHSGKFGPWWHRSWYQLTENGTWKYLGKNGGHYNTRHADKWELPFGSPRHVSN